MVTEAIVRESLRQEVLAATPGRAEALYEFWVPRSNERADVAVIGSRMDGFEIKTEHDTLRRLPRQAVAYSRLFDRCTVVVAERHLIAALEIVPQWWGVAVILSDHTLSFRPIRQAHSNHAVDPETLVRLLWRQEVRSALSAFGVEPDPRASRFSMWQSLLSLVELEGLKEVVRKALLGRNPDLTHFRSRQAVDVNRQPAPLPGADGVRIPPRATGSASRAR